MREIIDRRRGLAAAASLSVIAGLLAACSAAPSGPAPVYIGGTGQLAAKAPPAMTAWAPPPTIAKAALPSMTKRPPPRSAKITSDVIPLDASPPKPFATVEPSPPASTSAPTPTSGVSGGRFPWPVNGRLLAGYGRANGEAHNQGINIAAPLGTPVRSIDAGTVAYVGNEVKGYGNLVLVKHADGWISAYAHLDDVIVKKGDMISTGQVIAKVGETGGVGEPQLHFELRRGSKPVDPREFLEPAAKTT